jgi:hypothetical protein
MGVANGSTPNLQSHSALLRNVGNGTEAKADRGA